MQVHRIVFVEEGRTRIRIPWGLKRLISSGLGVSERLSMGRWLFGVGLLLVDEGGAPGRVLGGDTGVDNSDSTLHL